MTLSILPLCFRREIIDLLLYYKYLQNFIDCNLADISLPFHIEISAILNVVDLLIFSDLSDISDEVVQVYVSLRPYGQKIFLYSYFSGF